MTSPWWCRALLGRVVRRGEREEVLGDLEEIHRRRVATRGTLRAWLATSADTLGLAFSLGGARVRSALGRGLVSRSELRMALRFLARTPLLSLTTVLALALGVGLAATTFTVVSAVLNPRLPFSGGDRFVEVVLRAPEDRGRTAPDEPSAGSRGGAGGPTPAATAVLPTVPGLAHLGRVVSRDAMLRVGPRGAELARAAYLTPETFRHLPWRPVVGRLLAGSDRAGAPAVALVGEELWTRSLGRDPGVVGRELGVAGRTVTVVGVLPADADFPVAADLWLPLTPDQGPFLPAPGSTASLVGVLAPGGSPEAVASQLRAALAGEERDGGAGPVRVEVRRFGEGAGGGMEGALLLALLLGFLVVVAGNVGNLMVARAAARRGEIAVRTALGAGRARLVVQLALEVALLTGMASVLALAASSRILAAVAASEARDLPPWIDLGLRPGVVAFTLGAALLCTVMAGVLPALRATRRDVEPSLREVGDGTVGRSFGAGHHAMVVGQIAVAVGVLGAAAVVHQGWIGGAGTGSLPAPVDRILVAQAQVPLDAGEPVAALRERLEGAVGELSGVEAVASSTHLPGTDAPLVPVEVEGEGPRPDGGAWSAVPVAGAGPGYFDLLGARPLAGRLLGTDDGASGAPPVAVVNASFVERRLGGAAAVGRRIRVAPGPAGTPGGWREIVGVVPDLGMSGVDGRHAAGVYLPLTDEARFRLLVRSDGSPASLVPELRAAAADLEAGVTLDAVRVLSQLLASLRRVYLLVGSSILVVGGVVLLLSLLGVYAILSFEVSRRTREIGIRLALGAGRVRILQPVLARVGAYVLAGGALGTALGFLLAEAARATLVARFPPPEPWVFAALWAVVAGAALLAALVPLRRVLSVTPARSLQAE